MVDEVPVRKAVDTAWAVYLATHHDVDAADSRRCLLERNLQGRFDATQGTEELTCSGLAISTGFPRIHGEAGGSHNWTDSCRKREAELDVVRSFVLVFRDSGLGDAVPLIEPSHPIGQANIRASNP
jgi:hypothetical protein